ncbi:T9SS type B sorting domain-containing protein [Nonlabens ulvanivorans]|uniref:T9SS type B sorting domain-containing protein n=1 Tax=Nonlabens ulvanivorans TaxID=906888 RepID=UPI00329A5E9F
MLDKFSITVKDVNICIWNGFYGTYNGNPMPSSDYWYLVELSDGRSFKGHFALKR